MGYLRCFYKKSIWKYKNQVFTLYFKVLFMSDQNQQAGSLQDVKDIRLLMERSSRFISLSGLSGVAAGVFAIIGAAIARYVIFKDYYLDYNERGHFAANDFKSLKLQLIVLAVGVFSAAFFSAFYFTWKKSNKQGLSLWNPVSRRLFWNMAIPLVAGGFLFWECCSTLNGVL